MLLNAGAALFATAPSCSAKWGRAIPAPEQLYFPCGTPDLGDISGETVDLSGSIVRELAEETGICVTERMFSPSWRVVFDGQRVACINIIDWPEPARTLLARVESHIAAESDPELARAHLVRGRAELSRFARSRLHGGVFGVGDAPLSAARWRISAEFPARPV